MGLFWTYTLVVGVIIAIVIFAVIFIYKRLMEM